ncbi:SDR family oxidoreductase [Prosthecochloris sp. HL-130-GSB]|jgi:chlorophyll(ide) b reductase|uniref:SDR family oxidoreductase n=1 Tax=Prosthecochloris sp. HL-130-GSB TaxID=1974213 RepID=UPI000A1C1326|nr:SDR family oxidoreductase [Prosthecochloris sp. HL-130-GSB]ARM30903.1 short-chain dehydrogenase [Prosthecochloris sp. HL-130-GSB]
MRDVDSKHLCVVITGGTRGLGYALAKECIRRGDRVLICGRSHERVRGAVSTLRVSGPGEVYGEVCDVTNPDDIVRFAASAVSKLGQIDRWINNAGTAGERKAPLWKLSDKDILATCSTNLCGTLLLCRAALHHMLLQPSAERPVYHLFNFGFSPFGVRFSRSPVPHKASKTGVAAVTQFLDKELRMAGNTSIGVHEVSPGLVQTDLLLKGTDEATRAFLLRSADTPDMAASMLAGKIRNARGSGTLIRSRPLPLMIARMLVRQLLRTN